ncbi:hypothetical protein RRV45_15310 [Bacillus sp. DTU_2020_1000418_1_SI_GHA_SEK_038]|uniref:hypothetical protein n=1 Tax=Bacillus sp. DTU_2020_1000418_1_SI_GHA_SEK_038 TaxID=3077585 RepID=UPI0028EA63B7|nr:hypothetical protein [Bacillus sp. DTU_2020_1000418_1_SI_GHA_SEK_038]WNS74278.1 hypothetical protein RRV45_15310 [Bacillus sp. DTU_2020_1000418_1_SI_GHA_SEK_038]
MEKVIIEVEGQAKEGVVIDSYNSDYDGRKMLVVKCDELGNDIKNVFADNVKNIGVNKEKLMEFISNAIDNGAQIEMSFNSFGRSREDAEKLAAELSGITDEPVNLIQSNGVKWLSVGNISANFRGTFFYSNYMVEDVDLSGGEELARASND